MMLVKYETKELAASIDTLKHKVVDLVNGRKPGVFSKEVSSHAPLFECAIKQPSAFIDAMKDPTMALKGDFLLLANSAERHPFIRSPGPMDDDDLTRKALAGNVGKISKKPKVLNWALDSTVERLASAVVAKGEALITSDSWLEGNNYGDLQRFVVYSTYLLAGALYKDVQSNLERAMWSWRKDVKDWKRPRDLAMGMSVDSIKMALTPPGVPPGIFGPSLISDRVADKLLLKQWVDWVVNPPFEPKGVYPHARGPTRGPKA